MERELKTERIPSLHLTREGFRSVLQELGKKRFPVDKFFELAMKYNVNSRAMVISDRISEKMAERISKSTVGDAYLAADIYYTVRKALNHRGVRKPTQDSGRGWTQCKKLADMCNEYSKEYGMKPRNGFIDYIKTGFKLMGNNTKKALQVLPNMYQDIVDYKEAQQNLHLDVDSSLTEKVHDYYVSVIAERTGLRENYKNNPSEYSHFVELKDYCLKNGIDYKDYIDAMFEGLAWCNGLPEPSRFLTEKMKQYYVKYMFKYKQKVNTDEPKVQDSLWNLINEEDE